MTAFVDQALAKLDKLKQPAKRRRKPRLTAVDDGPQSSTTPEFSDDALALNFVASAFNQFRASPGLGWMVDDGVVWSRDECLQRFDAARRVCRSAASRCDDEGEAKRIASSRTVSAVLTLAQADQRIVLPADVWDADQMLLNTVGGVVNLTTGTCSPRGRAFVTQAAMAAPSSAPCPTWLRFINEIFCGDSDLIEFVKRATGYCFTGNRREQVLFFFYGLGANGKSVFVDCLLRLAGSYGLKLPASVLMQSKGERHPTEVAQLRGKRLAVSSELGESDFWNEPLLKEMTGDATTTARFMRQDFFEFQMTHKHIIVGNFKPRLRGGDPAMARRMLLVPFMASFKGANCDPHMLDKLMREAPGIMQWIVSGAQAWASEGLAIPESVRAASADYMADHDDLALWMDECCVRDGGDGKAGDLYASFGAWKKARGEHASSMTSWGSRLTCVPGIAKRKAHGVIHYCGVRLTAVEMEAINAARR